jgi:rhodanese-related sulfurtransferase
MLSGYETIIVVAVFMIYGAIRLLPRLIAGLGAYVSALQVKHDMDQDQPLVLLDVRSPREFAAQPGHIPGAINAPLAQLKDRLTHDEFLRDRRDQPVITICQTDSRAVIAVRILKRFGFTQPRILSGGMNTWEQEGYPVVTAAKYPITGDGS